MFVFALIVLAWTIFAENYCFTLIIGAYGKFDSFGFFFL